MARKRRTTKPRPRSPHGSHLEKTFDKEWKLKYSHPIQPQHRFHPVRAWRFDFAFPEAFLAIEIQGYGTGHTSYSGMMGDYEKHNEAIKHGWSIIYLMSAQIKGKEIKTTLSYCYKILQTRLQNQELLAACHQLNIESRKHVLLPSTDALEQFRRELDARR